MLTDSEIAKNDGSKSTARELVPWNDDGEVATETGLEGLDGVSSNGWGTEDMFKYNESNYNIHSTYRDEMPEYT